MLHDVLLAALGRAACLPLPGGRPQHGAGASRLKYKPLQVCTDLLAVAGLSAPLHFPFYSL